MTKDEFIGKFSDKDKIEIAEKYLGMMYDQMISNDYCQVATRCALDTQVIQNAIENLATQALRNDMVNNMKLEHPVTLYS